MSACSNFQPHRFIPDKCCDCFRPKSEHSSLPVPSPDPTLPPRPLPSPHRFVLETHAPVIRPRSSIVQNRESTIATRPPIIPPRLPIIPLRSHPRPDSLTPDSPDPPPLRSQSTNADRPIRRILFVGPTGVGKSTVINILYNNDARAHHMSQPAGTDDGSAGVTSFFTTYYDIPHYGYTDSIGLGDNRFKNADILSPLKSVVTEASVGYNKIYLCLKYGRIPTEVRSYIDMITTMFGKGVLKWTSIIFTDCSHETMTKNDYISKNQNDKDFISIVQSVGTIIFGDNRTDPDATIDNILYERRLAFLRRIKKDIDEQSQAEYFTLKKNGLISRIKNAIHWPGSSRKSVNIAYDIKEFAKAVSAAMQKKKYEYYYGECSICTDDITGKNKPIITICCHVYHEDCLRQWFNQYGNNSCPVCRMTLNIHDNESVISLVNDT